MILKSGGTVPAKQICSPSFEVFGYELPELVDDRDGVYVALTLRVSQVKRPWRRERYRRSLALVHGFAQHHG